MKSAKGTRFAFFGYAHNLAEITRGIEVAKKLRDRGARIQFFTHGGPHEGRISEAGFPLTTLDPVVTEAQHSRFMDLDHGRARGELYTALEWRNFAASEITALQKFKPHAMYAGFNLPCVISSRVTGIPLIFLLPAQGTRSYYEAGLGVFPEFLENGFTRALPHFMKDRLFNFLMNYVNYLPIRELNKALTSFGPPPLRSSFEVVSGDLVLLSDLPEITGLAAHLLPPSHEYIGPLFADLPVKIPREVKKVFSRKGLKIYCAMGSSGSSHVMRTAIHALKGTDYNVVAATTSILDPREFEPFSDRFFVTRYVPALQVNEMADIAVTHGGQGTLQNSMRAGRPVIGTPFQFEQQGNLQMIARAGAGVKIPLRHFTSENLLKHVEHVAREKAYSENARRLSERLQAIDGASNAADAILRFVRNRKEN